MLQFKCHRKLKGSIALYIMIWSMVLLTIALLGLSLECERRKNIAYLEKQLEYNSEVDKYREYLFSMLIEKVKLAGSITQESIDKFISDNYQSFSIAGTIDFKNNGRLYLKEDGNIIITYFDEFNIKRFECYKIKVRNEKVKFCIIQDGILPEGNDL